MDFFSLRQAIIVKNIRIPIEIMMFTQSESLYLSLDLVSADLLSHLFHQVDNGL